MISFAGLIFAVAFISFFIWLFSGAYNFALKRGEENLLKDRKSRFMFLAFVFAGAWMCYWLLCQNRYIYHWDYGMYWKSSFINMHMLFSRPLLAILRFGKTILFDEYNNILPMLIAIPLKALGYTFTRYVFINYICFFVPACFILLSIVKSQIEKSISMVIFMFIIFTFLPFYRAMLMGYIDVACLIPASLSILLLKDYDAISLSCEQIKRDMYISAILLCTIMFRRYFAFFVLGYVFALLLLSIYFVFAHSEHESKIKLFRNALLNIIIIGLFALTIMLVFFAPMLIRVLSNNYSQMYEGYNFPFKYKILGVINQFGILTFILAGAGLLMSLITKIMRRYSCFCAVSLIFTIATFFRFQAMGGHHIYTISIQLFILVCIFILQILHFLRKRIFRNCALFLCFSLMFLGFMNSYFPVASSSLKTLSCLFGNVYKPLQRNDIHELNELADHLNSMTDNTNKKVYILSNSSILNSSTMASLRLPYELSALHNMTGISDLDLRDGFSVGFLSADFFVIGDPVQIHLMEGSQEVVRFPAVEIMSSDSQLGRHFIKHERTFTLDDGVKVYIYEKKSDFTHEDLKYMADYFAKVHPGHEKIFADRILGRVKPVPYGRSTSNAIIKWLVRTGIYTPEEVAEGLNLPIETIKARIQ